MRNPQKKHAFLIFLTAVLLSGCAVHRQSEIAPPADMPMDFAEKRSVTAPLDPEERWWETFDDGKLDSLMEKAFAGNLDIGQAVSRVEQSQALLRQSSASTFPYLNFGAGAGRSKQQKTLGGKTGNSYSLSLQAGYEIDLWKKLESRTKAAELNASASVETLKGIYLTISADVADLYYLIIEQRAQLELTDKTIDDYTASLDLVEARFVQGMVTALDVYQARQSLFTAKSRRSQFETGLKTAEHALAVLTGAYPEQTSEKDLAVLPDIPEFFPEGLPSEILVRRPDIQAELLQLKARDYETAEAVAERFPSINLIGEYGHAASDFTGTTLSGSTWNLAANLAMPIIDWGGRKAEVARRQAVFEESYSRYRKTVLSAFKEVADALAMNRSREVRIEYLKEKEKAASSALRLARDQYLEGQVNYLTVLAQQTVNFDTQSLLLSERRQLISDRISLARATGGSWMNSMVETRLSERKHIDD